MRSLTTETDYLVLLDTVTKEVRAAFTLYHGLEEFERLTREDENIRGHVAEDVGFWQPYRAVMQYAVIMTLSKIFDPAADAFTIQKLVATSIANPQIFSRESLAARRSPNGAKPEWLDDFVASAWEPVNSSALKYLKKELGPHVTEFQKTYIPIRDAIYAHRLMTDEQAGIELFPHTNIKALGQTVQFLYQLVHAIQDLYNNGKQPTTSEQPFEHHAKLDRQKVAKVLRKFAHGQLPLT